MDIRYGSAHNLDDYVWKARAMAYEGERAMFKAYERNKYGSTGAIQWMLNNAWPSTIWHLFDYYLRSAAGYFATRKACEPLHALYSYDDGPVWVTNDYPRAFDNLKLTARVSRSMDAKFSRGANPRTYRRTAASACSPFRTRFPMEQG